MTKTWITFLSHHFANLDPSVMMLLGTTVDGFFVWNFEFGSLGFI